MEKILTYIKQGKGRGLLFLLASAVLLTIVLMFTLKNAYIELKPDIVLVANEFLPITVTDGKITEPANTYKRLDLDLGGEGHKKDIFPVVLDTRSETSAIPTEPQGLFIMPDTVYMISGTDIKRFSLSMQNGVLNKENFTEIMNNVVGYLSVLVAVMMIVVVFLMYLLKTWLAALLGALGLKIMHKPDMLPFAGLMRLNAVLVAFFELAVFVVSWYSGLPITGFQTFLIVVALELLFLYREKTQNV